MIRQRSLELETLNRRKTAGLQVRHFHTGSTGQTKHKESCITDREIVLQAGTHQLQKQPLLWVSSKLPAQSWAWQPAGQTRTKFLLLHPHCAFCFPSSFPFHKSSWTSQPWAEGVNSSTYCEVLLLWKTANLWREAAGKAVKIHA